MARRKRLREEEEERLRREREGKAQALKDAAEEKSRRLKDLNDQYVKKEAEEVKKAEDEINQLKKNAPAKINKIAIEIASELTQKLIGAEVNNSSISAIVDDLTKRNGDKYYGN